MKNLFLIASITALFVCNVNAQEVKFGAKSGVNFASLSGDDADATDGITSFHIGGVVNIGISDKFAVQPELVYSSQGYTYTDSYEEIGSYTGKLDYINLPILADIIVGEGFSFQVGPQIGFKITDKEKGQQGESYSLGAESIDFGGAFGVQYKMQTGLFFQSRYTLGLSDVVKDVDAKNNVLQLSVGYMF